MALRVLAIPGRGGVTAGQTVHLSEQEGGETEQDSTCKATVQKVGDRSYLEGQAQLLSRAHALCPAGRYGTLMFSACSVIVDSFGGSHSGCNHHSCEPEEG